MYLPIALTRVPNLENIYRLNFGKSRLKAQFVQKWNLDGVYADGPGAASWGWRGPELLVPSEVAVTDRRPFYSIREVGRSPLNKGGLIDRHSQRWKDDPRCLASLCELLTEALRTRIL